MKYVALIAALAIALLLATRRAGPSRVDEAISEAGLAPVHGQGDSTSSLRKPIDKTRATLDQVRERNRDGDF
jgi:hypothetical protein